MRYEIPYCVIGTLTLINSKQAPKNIKIELLEQGNLRNVQLLVETTIEIS